MIQFKNVSFSYTGNTYDGLKNINLTIEDGECILLCGRSGCGKTTFTRMINGLVPHFFPGKLKGEVIVNGLPVVETEVYKISQQVGSVFQNPRTQFFNVDTDSEIAFGIENAALPIAELKKKVVETKKDLKIENLSSRNIFELSGGEKQKIAFASVYAMKPNIFLLDEPSSNLDIEAIEELRRTLVRLKKENKTILVAEHRLYYLLDIVDRIFYFDNGQLVKIYTPNELRSLNQRELEKMGLRAVDMHRITPTFTNHEIHRNTLTLQNISLSYNKEPIMKNINLTATGGEVIGIFGGNGAGKTTFCRAICGLHKDMSGKISLNNNVCNRKTLMKQSYLVMQDVNYQLFSESVENECVLGIKNPNNDLVKSILKELELFKFSQVHPNTLSGGQKQRLAVAVSMICDKEVLVFDEPTSGLDYDSMLKVANLISRLSQMGKIIFITTHDYEFACRICSRILCFENGKLQADKMITQENEMFLHEIFTLDKEDEYETKKST